MILFTPSICHFCEYGRTGFLDIAYENLELVIPYILLFIFYLSNPRNFLLLFSISTGLTERHYV